MKVVCKNRIFYVQYMQLYFLIHVSKGNIMSEKIIVASVSKPHGVYRVGNNSPWPPLTKEQRVLHNLTRGHVLVVDPITYSSLPESIDYILCIIVAPLKTQSHLFRLGIGDLLCENIEEAIALATKIIPEKNIIFWGDKNVLMESIPLCTDIHVLEVELDCRTLGPLTFFPEALLLHEHDGLLPQNRVWMIEGEQRSTEKLDYLGITVPIRHVHYKNRNPDLKFMDKD